MTSLIVGTVLTVINQGPAIMAGELTWERIFQILLTFAVPYLVSTTSSILTRNEMRAARVPARRSEKGLRTASNAVPSNAIAL